MVLHRGSLLGYVEMLPLLAKHLLPTALHGVILASIIFKQQYMIDWASFASRSGLVVLQQRKYL